MAGLKADSQESLKADSQGVSKADSQEKALNVNPKSLERASLHAQLKDFDLISAVQQLGWTGMM